MSDDPRSIDARKALLVSRAELERMQITLAVHELRDRISPDPREDGPRSSRPKAIAAALIGIGLPLLGRQRLARVLRGASMAMTAWRVARHWRAGR